MRNDLDTPDLSEHSRLAKDLFEQRSSDVEKNDMSSRAFLYLERSGSCSSWLRVSTIRSCLMRNVMRVSRKLALCRWFSLKSRCTSKGRYYGIMRKHSKWTLYPSEKRLSRWRCPIFIRRMSLEQPDDFDPIAGSSNRKWIFMCRDELTAINRSSIADFSFHFDLFVWAKTKDSYGRANTSLLDCSEREKSIQKRIFSVPLLWKPLREMQKEEGLARTPC